MNDYVDAWVGQIGFVVLTASIVGLSTYYELQMAWWEMVLVCVSSVPVAYGLGMLVALTGSNMAFPAATLAQVILGFTNPGKLETNIVGAALSSAVAAQALALFQDMRFAVRMGVTPIEMAKAQGIGTFVGALCSAFVYYAIMELAFGCCPPPPDDKPADFCLQGCTIKMDGDLYANIGAQSTYTFAQVFSEYGLGRIFSDNPAFKSWCISLIVLTLVCVPLRRSLPKRIKPFFPDVIVMGVGAAAPSTVWYIISALLLFFIYRVYLPRVAPNFIKHYTFLSTSAAIMAGGIALLVVLVATSAGAGQNFVDGLRIAGGVHGDGCEYEPEIMPQF